MSLNKLTRYFFDKMIKKVQVLWYLNKEDLENYCIDFKEYRSHKLDGYEIDLNLSGTLKILKKLKIMFPILLQIMNFTLN